MQYVTAAPEHVVEAIAAVGRFAAARGWVPATSGNFSQRIDRDTIAITRSGRDKGLLGAADIAAIGLDAPIPAGLSAETPLHVARYRADPSVGAIVHVHTIAATVLSRRLESEGAVVFSGFEMQKAIAGVTTHDGSLRVPIFANAQDTTSLAAQIDARLGPAPAVPAYILAGHGIYAWGRTMDEARRHLEGVEFLLACTLEEWRIER